MFAVLVQLTSVWQDLRESIGIETALCNFVIEKGNQQVPRAGRRCIFRFQPLGAECVKHPFDVGHRVEQIKVKRRLELLSAHFFGRGLRLFWGYLNFVLIVHFGLISKITIHKGIPPIEYQFERCQHKNLGESQIFIDLARRVVV